MDTVIRIDPGYVQWLVTEAANPIALDDDAAILLDTIMRGNNGY